MSHRSRIPPQMFAALEEGAQSYTNYENRLGATDEKLRRSYTVVRFIDAELAALAAIRDPLRIFALVDEGCPDVVANLPIVARAVEQSPFLSLFVLPRRDHWPFAAAYPGPDIANSRVPTYVAIGMESRERGILVERPAEITVALKPHIEKVYAKVEARFPGVARSALPADFVTELLAEGELHRADLADLERRGVVEWLLRCASAA